MAKTFAQHTLAMRKQKPGKSVDVFLQALHQLAKNCTLKAVTADQYHKEMVRDSFINGLTSPIIRQRLLENKVVDLQ